MKNDHIVFVDEEVYKKIVDTFGFAPSNLFINNYIPDKNQAIVVDSNYGNYNYGNYNYGNYNYGNYNSK